MTAVATPAEDEGSCEGSCDNGLISGGKLCGEEDKDSFGSGLVSGCVTMPGTDRREDEDGFRSGLISGGTLLGVGRFCGGGGRGNSMAGWGDSDSLGRVFSKCITFNVPRRFAEAAVEARRLLGLLS